jgi:hypothetical protein
MNKEDIIRMAQQCGLLEFLKDECPSKSQWDHLNQLLPEFAALVAAAEREACAKVCEDMDVKYEGHFVRASLIAAAIRARGQQ